MNPRFHIKNPLNKNQFGGTFGGPLLIPRVYSGTDRTFFFVSYQGGRRRTGSVGQAQVPTAQERNGDFSDWPVQLYNPLSGVPNPSGSPAVIRQPFASNQIPDDGWTAGRIGNSRHPVAFCKQSNPGANVRFAEC